MVSIIIPCFNQAHFLADAIESAIGQTYSHLQVIVIDDGSTDDTAEVAKRFALRTQFLQTTHQGVASARNRGVQAAEGKFLLFLDADDFLYRDTIEQFVAASVKNQSDVILYGSSDWCDAQGNVLDARQPPQLNDDPYLSLLRRNWLLMNTVFLSKEIVTRVGLFDTELANCEDWDFWIRVAAEGYAFVAVPTARSAYRRHSHTRSAQVPTLVTSCWQILDKQLVRNGHRRDVRQAIDAAKQHYREQNYQHLNAELQRFRAQGNWKGGFRFAVSRLREHPRLMFQLGWQVGWYLVRRLPCLIGLKSRATFSPSQEPPASDEQSTTTESNCPPAG